MQSILYISYDGMLEPLGQSQVLAYLERLAPGRSIHLLSFEKPDDWSDDGQVRAMENWLSERSIHWHRLRYHKRPPVISTVFDMALGALNAIRIVAAERIHIFHCRNMLCAAISVPAAMMTGGKLLFDIRGFWADERVDGGMIPANGTVYRVLKRLERWLFKRADHIVTLTRASLPFLRDDPRFGNPQAPITMIPTCVDLGLFLPAKRRKKTGQFVLGYVGQVGTWYLMDEMIDVFIALRIQIPGAKFLIVNRHQQKEIEEALERRKIPKGAFEIVGATRSEVPAQMGRMSIGLALIKPAFSKISSSPTKFAEYLACGVPCIGNPGVGDVAPDIESNQVGVVIADFSEAGLARSVREIMALTQDPNLSRRCRRLAEGQFALDRGVARYEEIYDELCAGEGRAELCP